MKFNSKYVAWLLPSLIGGALSYSTSLLAATEVTSIAFKGGEKSSVIEIMGSGPLTFTKQENSADKQIVIDLTDATLGKTVARKLDTSSFNSKVSLISPYQVDGKPADSRIVIQLRDFVSADVTTEGNLLKISVPNSTPPVKSAAAANPAPVTSESSNTAPGDLAQVPVPDAEKMADNTSPETRIREKKVDEGSVPKSDKLDDFISSRASRRFIGKPITLQVRDAEVADVLRLIGDSSGFNIILSDEVKGKVTLSLVDVPWDQALDVVLQTQKLGAERNNNLLRVVPLASLTAEKQAQLQAKLASDASAPRVTRIFPISYAKTDDLALLLTKFAGSGAGAPTVGASAGISSTTTVQVDNRTNSLIVRDIPDNVERMKKLIEILDTQTPQVLIEAKVVEAREGSGRNISGNLGVGGGGSTFFGASFNNGNANSSLTSIPTSTTAGDSTFGVSPSLSILPGISRLNAVLQLQENEDELKVLSSPRAVVLNKETARIVQGTPVALPVTTVVNGVTQTTQQITIANLSLAVTPTVTNEGSILMDLNITKDEPIDLGPGIGSGVGPRNITTKVLVESGSTLVLGGIYQTRSTHAESGVPYLRKIPLIGVLFGSETYGSSRSELFIFITPRILNPKEAGLTNT